MYRNHLAPLLNRFSMAPLFTRLSMKPLSTSLLLASILLAGQDTLASSEAIGIEDVDIAKFYQYGYQVEDTYTGKLDYNINC